MPISLYVQARINIYSMNFFDIVFVFRYKKTMSRKHFTTSIEENLIKELKKLAIDLDCAVNDLLEKAIEQILFKHGKAPKK